MESAELVPCTHHPLDRRQFITLLGGGLLAAPLVAEAQQTGKVHRIGWLSTGPHPFIADFRAGLRDLGYVEGQNLVIEQRYSEGQPDRLPGLARELIAHRVEVLVTSGSAAALAAKETTTTLPIVSVSSDLLGVGVVRSLAQPGGNVTGLSLLSAELTGKWLELLMGAVPTLKRVAVLGDTSQSSGVQLEGLNAAAATRGVQVIPLKARDAAEIDAAVSTAIREHVGGLIPVSSPVFAAQKRHLVALAAKHRLPTIYEHRDFVDSGGLMSYGPNLNNVFRRAAIYVDKILKGAKPGDLPVEQPTEFELVINLKTAKALGLTIPPSLLARADQVIE
jgi:putative ABC transport system substrate-binding protein